MCDCQEILLTKAEQRERKGRRGGGCRMRDFSLIRKTTENFLKIFESTLAVGNTPGSAHPNLVSVWGSVIV